MAYILDCWNQLGPTFPIGQKYHGQYAAWRQEISSYLLIPSNTYTVDLIEYKMSPQITCVYGSVTGKAQSIAEQIVEAGSREGIKVIRRLTQPLGFAWQQFRQCIWMK